jgi:hypothetical protein
MDRCDDGCKHGTLQNSEGVNEMLSTSKAREIALDLIEQFAAQEEIVLFTLNQSPPTAPDSVRPFTPKHLAAPKPPQPAYLCHREKPASAIAGFDHAAARAEGWDLIHSGHLTDGSPNVTIQHIIREDEPHPIFPNDPAAWAHVVRQARDGSHLHIQALDLACQIERLGIEASCGTW